MKFRTAPLKLWLTLSVLRKLIDRIDVSKVSHEIKPKDVAATNKDLLEDQKDASSSTITHEWLWPTVGNFFRPKDVIVTETGICGWVSFLTRRDI